MIDASDVTLPMAVTKKIKKDMPITNIYELCHYLDIAPKQIIVKDDVALTHEHYQNDEVTVDVTDIVPETNRYNAVELFAGAGGLLLGLENAGFNTVAAIEIDAKASETLRLNRPHMTVIDKDIADVVEEGLFTYIDKDVEIDVLSGGYPCQSFSYAGKQRGLDDTRGTLFYWYAKALEALKPKVFIAENVRGLMSHDGGKTLQKMIDVFDDAGYDVTYRLMNAKNYGVAQKRERIFIVGVRKDLNHSPFQFPKALDTPLVLRDVLVDVPQSPGRTYTKRKKEIMDMVPAGGCWRDLPVDVQKEYMKASFFLGGGKTGMARRLSWDEPSLTLTTAPDMKQTERCHPDETRPLTVREYARIQSFPDDWAFVGSVSDTYKQIGNAVPVNLAKYVGLSVYKYLSGLDK